MLSTLASISSRPGRGRRGRLPLLPSLCSEDGGELGLGDEGLWAPDLASSSVVHLEDMITSYVASFPRLLYLASRCPVCGNARENVRSKLCVSSRRNFRTDLFLSGILCSAMKLSNAIRNRHSGSAEKYKKWSCRATVFHALYHWRSAVERLQCYATEQGASRFGTKHEDSQGPEAKTANSAILACFLPRPLLVDRTTINSCGAINAG